MTKRRKVTAELKAKVALDALRDDKTIQEIAARHKVYPNQVSTWKRQAVDGLGEMFSSDADRERARRTMTTGKIALVDDTSEDSDAPTKRGRGRPKKRVRDSLTGQYK